MNRIYISIYIFLIFAVAIILNALNPNIKLTLGSVIMLAWLLFTLTLWIIFWVLKDSVKKYWCLNYAISSFLSAFLLNLFIANYLVGYDSGFLNDLLKYDEQAKHSVYDYFRGYLFSLYFCGAFGFLPPFCLFHIIFMAAIHWLIKLYNKIELTNRYI